MGEITLGLGYLGDMKVAFETIFGFEIKNIVYVLE